MKEISELLDLLKLEQIEENLFRGYSKTVGSSNVFGGQVLAQALSAAINTVPADRHVHSLHSYFILPGNLDRFRNLREFNKRNFSNHVLKTNPNKLENLEDNLLPNIARHTVLKQLFPLGHSSILSKDPV